MIKRGLDSKKYDEYYEVYRKVRDEEEVAGKINKEDIEYFIRIIKRYTSELENESKKAAEKRH